MSKYRLRSDGSLKSQGELRRLNPNVSLPRVWKQPVFDLLQIDPVLASPKPEVGEFETARLNGAVQDANGNWVENWITQDTFSDQLDSEGNVIKTKAELEVVHRVNTNTSLLEGKKAEIRRLFNEELSTPVTDSGGVSWNGGMDSALAIDGAVRIAENAGFTQLALYDANNTSHTVTIAEGKTVAAVVGGRYQVDFARKQTALNTLDAIDLTFSTAKADIEAVTF